MNESVGNLSGGERQSLVALLATVGDPSLLLFDEFTASLDPQMATDVLTRTSNLIRSKRLSAFMVTHRHSEAISYADRVVVLNRGKVHTIITRGSAEFAIDYLSSLFKELYYQKLD